MTINNKEMVEKVLLYAPGKDIVFKIWTSILSNECRSKKEDWGSTENRRQEYEKLEIERLKVTRFSVTRPQRTDGWWLRCYNWSPMFLYWDLIGWGLSYTWGLCIWDKIHKIINYHLIIRQNKFSILFPSFNRLFKFKRRMKREVITFNFLPRLSKCMAYFTKGEKKVV